MALKKKNAFVRMFIFKSNHTSQFHMQLKSAGVNCHRSLLIQGFKIIVDAFYRKNIQTKFFVELN